MNENDISEPKGKKEKKWTRKEGKDMTGCSFFSGLIKFSRGIRCFPHFHGVKNK